MYYVLLPLFIYSLFYIFIPIHTIATNTIHLMFFSHNIRYTYYLCNSSWYILAYIFVGIVYIMCT